MSSVVYLDLAFGDVATRDAGVQVSFGEVLVEKLVSDSKLVQALTEQLARARSARETAMARCAFYRAKIEGVQEEYMLEGFTAVDLEVVQKCCEEHGQEHYGCLRV